MEDIEGLTKEFIEETVEALTALDLDLVRLEQEPHNQELIGNIFRLMHTIKGTCGFLNLTRLEKTAHATESLLDMFRSNKMEVNENNMTMLFMGIDRVRYLVTQVKKNNAEPTGDDTDILTAIEDIMAPKSETAQTPTAPETAQVKTEPPPAPPAEETTAPDKGPEYLRVQMSVLEDLINMVSELVLTRNQLLQLVRLEENLSLKTPLQRLNRIVSDLQDSVMKTRMQPIGNAWSKLPRLVRDLGTETKKKISFEMFGEDTELDRQVLELIKDPLTHMVRNSCDHGIEPPAERITAGKKEQGRITVKAYHEGGFVVIQISDDGKGLDPQKIASKALQKGLINAEQMGTLTAKQALNLIMLPGFSTAEQITNISGRGVGMDVVRANIQKIGGSIDMDSIVGKGTVFTIQIPLTLAIISALIVEIDRHRYAIPQMNIQELVAIGPAQNGLIEYIDDKPVLRLRNRIISLLNSAVLFKTSAANDLNAGSHQLIVVISAGASHYGIIVDQIYDTEEVVIKSVSSVLKNANIFAGNTILGDGRVIMILDPAAIARRFNIDKEQTDVGDSDQKSQGRTKEYASLLIFKAGDGTPKAMPLELISRLQMFKQEDIAHSADKIMARFNDGLIQLCFVDGETQQLNEKEVMALILSDDRSQSVMGLIIDQVIDIVEGELDLSASTVRPGILGSMILGSHTVDIVDITHFIDISQANWFSKKTHEQSSFAVMNAATQQIPAANDFAIPQMPPGSQKKKVLVVDDSNFYRGLLYPILTTAGYAVTMAVDAQQAVQLHDEGQMFDIILSDIEMPGMNGYEFVEKMRAGSAWQHLPFIAITSHNTAVDAEYGYKKGFNAYIGKLDKAELFRAISNIPMPSISQKAS